MMDRRLFRQRLLSILNNVACTRMAFSIETYERAERFECGTKYRMKLFCPESAVKFVRKLHTKGPVQNRTTR